MWVDKGREFYNRSMKSWLEKNGIEMYSTHKHMTLISKNVYTDKLNDIVNEYNKTYHRTIKMKPIDVKDNTYIESSKEVNDKKPKFQFADDART